MRSDKGGTILGSLKSWYWYRTIIGSLLSQYRNVQEQQKLGIGQLFSTEKVKKFKTSDTLFILGGGPSINRLTQEQLRFIEKHDSFGFTNWTMHDLIPTFYMNEFKNRTPELAQCGYQELYNLVKRKDEYSNTAVILRAGETDFSSVKGFSELGFPLKNVYYALDIPVHGRDRKEFRKSVDFLKSSKLIKSKFLLLNKTSSLFRIIMFGAKLNYRNIVLCGIDLTGSAYFFEEKRTEYERKDLIFPVLTNYRGPVHKTNDPDQSTGGMIISDVVLETRDSILNPRNINLFVAHRESGLYPDVDLFPW